MLGGPAWEDLICGDELLGSAIAGSLQCLVEAGFGVRDGAEMPQAEDLPQMLEAPHLVGCVEGPVILVEELGVPPVWQ